MRDIDRPLTNSEYSDMRDRFHTPEENYELLRGDVQAVRGKARVWDTDHTLSKYTQATDHTIGMLDGSIQDRSILDPIDPERSQQSPDAVVWLDKSARPVSWFVDALWEQFANKDAKKPTDEFLNIDRTVWFEKQGHEREVAERRLGPGDFDIDAVSPFDIARIRAVFSEGSLDRDNWVEDVWNKPTRFDGKNILIIDEVKNKGGTLAIATQLLKRAIPAATVSGAYFWSSGTYALGGLASEAQMETAPVWYSKEDPRGRGIGDLSKAYQEQLPDTDENFKRKIGWTVLSTPLHDPETFAPLYDGKAARLRQDIAYLSYAIANGEVIRNPSPSREDDDYDTILEQQELTMRQRLQYSIKRSAENSPR